MRVLAIESATALVGVAVADADGPRAGCWATGGRRHGETLAPAIVHVLAQAELHLGDLEAIVVDIGPGLFTSLRVGVATAKGLAQGLGIGVVGVTSVATLARAAFDGGWPGDVLSVVDARRHEVFAARYSRHDGVVDELDPPRRFAPQELAAFVAGTGTAGRVLAVGDGARRYAAVLQAVDGLHVTGPTLAAPDPAVLARVGQERLAAGVPPTAPGDVVPLYLRDADVRINWIERGAVGGR